MAERDGRSIVQRIEDCVAFASTLSRQDELELLGAILNHAAQLVGSSEFLRASEVGAIVELFMNAGSGFVGTEAEGYSEPIARFAVEVARRSSESEPEAILPILGASLANLATVLSATSQTSDSFAINEEAMLVYRQLVTWRQSEYSLELANVLNNIAGDLREHGRLNEAQERCEEAVALYQHLCSVETDSSARSFYYRRLVQSQANCASIFVDSGNIEEALRTLRQANDVSREEFDEDDPELKTLLARLDHITGKAYAETGEHGEALALLARSVDRYRSLVREGREEVLPELAAALAMHGSAAAEVGPGEDALSSTEESTRLYLGMPRHLSDTAVALQNLARRYLSVGQLEPAESAGKECLRHFRYLTERDPESHRASLVTALIQQAKVLSELGREDEAMALIDEGMRLAEEPDYPRQVGSKASLRRSVEGRAVSSGARVAFVDYDTAVVSVANGRANVWEYPSGAMRSLTRFVGRTVAIDRTDEPHPAVLSVADRGRISLVEVDSGNSIRVEALNDSPDATVYAVCRTPRRVALGQKDGQILIWNGERQQTSSYDSGGTGWPCSLIFSDDGRWLASGSTAGTLKVFDCNTGTAVASSGQLAGRGWITSLSFIGGREGSIAIGRSSGAITVWDYSTGRALVDLAGHVETVNDIQIAATAGRTILASCSDDRTVRIWDIATGRQVQIIREKDPIVSLAINRRGNVVAVSDGDGVVRLWSLESKSPRPITELAPRG